MLQLLLIAFVFLQGACDFVDSETLPGSRPRRCTADQGDSTVGCPERENPDVRSKPPADAGIESEAGSRPERDAEASRPADAAADDGAAQEGDHELLQVASTEPAGKNCAAGGTRIAAGVDLNDDGMLTANEELRVTFICGSAFPACNEANWRARFPDLRGCNLQNADLSRVDLADADLTGALLSGANLLGATLDRVRAVDLTACPDYLPEAWTCLGDADGLWVLAGPAANLDRVDLSGLVTNALDLSNASLRGADLSEANLYQANLSGADLTQAVLTGANLYGVPLTGANLSLSIFDVAEFYGIRATDLVGSCPVQLPAGIYCVEQPRAGRHALVGPGVDLTDTDLSFADLRVAADQTGARFSRADLTGVNLEGVVLRQANFEDTVLDDVQMVGADLTNATIVPVSARGLRAWPLVGCTPGYYATWACVQGPHSFALVARGADLRGADLEGFRLVSVDLTDADLTGATLRDADLKQAVLTGATLRDTVLDGAKTRLAGDCPAVNPEGMVCIKQPAETLLLGARVDVAGASVYANYLSSPSQLVGLDLTGADLAGTSWYGGDLRSATFDEADLTQAGFNGANLHGASFRDVQGWYLYLGYGDYSRTDFTRADLTYARMEQSTFDGSTFEGTILEHLAQDGSRFLDLVGGCPSTLPTEISCVLLGSGLRALVGSNFMLEGANLSGANLSRLVLGAIEARGANFSFADLSDTLLGGSDLGDANLTGANLRGALLPAWIWGANLSGAALEGADLRESLLIRVDLTDATMAGSLLEGVTSGELRGCPASLPPGWSCVRRPDGTGGALFGPGSKFQELNLRGADLRGANFPKASLVKATLVGSDFRGANLAGADLKQADLTDCDFRNANLDGADLTDAKLAGADFTGASLVGARLAGDLQGMSFVGADLRSASFSGNLSGADLSDADLSGAFLGSVDLTDALLIGADLRDAFLGFSTLDRANLTEALMAGVRAPRISAVDLVGLCPLSLPDGFRCVPQASSSGHVLVGPEALVRNADLRGSSLVAADLTGTWFVEDTVLADADLSSSAAHGMRALTLLGGCPTALPGGWRCYAGSTAGTSFLAGPFANLSQASFAGIDFGVVDLTGADLSASDLAGAQLADVELDRVRASRLRGCPQSLPTDYVCLATSTVEFALFGRGVNLSDQTLTHLDLRAVVWGDAQLVGANLTGTDLSGADLSQVNLAFASTTDLEGTCPAQLPPRFECRAYPGRISLFGPQIASQGTDHSGQDLSSLDLEGALLSNTAFRRANFRGTNLRGASGNSCSFDEADFRGADMSGFSYAGASMRNVMTDADTTCPNGAAGPCSF